MCISDSLYSMLKKNFWKKKLNQFNKEEWEALCDRCGKCCLIKLEDEENGDIFYTNISCKLLCVKTGNCTNYINRKKNITYAVIDHFGQKPLFFSASYCSTAQPRIIRPNRH